MAKFLNTSGTTYILEQLISKALKRVVLVSPYLKFNKRIKQLIEDRASQGITFDVVYGKTKLSDAEKKWLDDIENLNLYFSEDLHAKCYLNEGHCIITSMNLYEFSQVNNDEMGVLLTGKQDPEAFADATAEAEKIIRISQREKQASEVKAPAKKAKIKKSVKAKITESKEKPKYKKIPTSAVAKKNGISTGDLVKSFKAAGYIFDDDGMDKLTDRGKEIGGEFRKGYSGYYFIWPEKIEISTLL